MLFAGKRDAIFVELKAEESDYMIIHELRGYRSTNNRRPSKYP